MSTEAETMQMPEGLSPLGKKAYEAIMSHLRKNDATDTGGCKAFYSPQEWEDRGERYGTGSVLVVVYDGGDHRRFFNLDSAFVYNPVKGHDVACYDWHEGMGAALGEVGLYFEECTGWFCAVYEV